MSPSLIDYLAYIIFSSVWYFAGHYFGSRSKADQIIKDGITKPMSLPHKAWAKNSTIKKKIVINDDESIVRRELEK